MDPDAAFIIFAMLGLVVLAFVGSVGLLIRAWKSNLSVLWKVTITVLMISFGIFVAAWIAQGVTGGASLLIPMIIIGSFLFALNFSLNIASRKVIRGINLPPSAKIALITILVTLIVPTVLLGIGAWLSTFDFLGGN